MKIQPILNQLKSQVTYAKEVRIAYGITNTDPSQVPIVYLHPLSEQSDGSTYDNLVVQQINYKFAVVYAAAIGNESLNLIREQVMSALLGFVIDSDYDAVQFVEGEILEITASTIYWRDTYQTERYVRQS